MGDTGYTVEVTNLSPNATEGDVYDFFKYSGTIEHVEVARSEGGYACTAYVTFKESHGAETAVLLNGATILDQRVCIVKWGHHEDGFNFWDRPSWRIEDDSETMQRSNFVSTPGEAVTVAQDAVKTMLAMGYTLSKDALTKAKAFDESHQVSATAAAKVAELSRNIGLTDKINTGVEAVRAADGRYHVSENTMNAMSATRRTATAAASSVLNSCYFSAGALWVSGTLGKAAKAAADLGNRNYPR